MTDKLSQAALRRIMPQDKEHDANRNFLLIMPELTDEIQSCAADVRDIFSITRSKNPAVIGNLVGVKQDTDIDDATYRRLLRSKVIKNTSECTIMDIEEFMVNLVSSVRIEVKDNQDMTFALVFHGKLTEKERDLVRSFRFVPTPAGVKFLNFSETAISVRCDKTFARCGNVRAG